MVTLVGSPRDPGWMANADDAAAIMEEVRESGLETNAFNPKSVNHRRGDFVALHVGVSFGGGAVVCALSTSAQEHSFIQPLETGQPRSSKG